MCTVRSTIVYSKTMASRYVRLRPSHSVRAHDEVTLFLLELAGKQPEGYLSAAIDPIALFLIGGAGLLMAGLLYGIFSPDRDGEESDREDPPPGGG